MNYRFEDFTEQNYIKLLKMAKNHLPFSFYDNYKDNNVLLWRHDIDFSMHRAYKLAQLEANENVYSTFFLHLHNEFYNVLEKEITILVHKILKLGHQIGLHFDPNYYSNEINNLQDLELKIHFEIKIIEEIFGQKVKVFSFHNPDVGRNWLSFNQNEIGGVINTYGQFFRDNFTYCSDSNGYWRYQRLEDVLQSQNNRRLQILTHPGWWVDFPLSPRDRVSRSIEGRSKKRHEEYDDFFVKNTERINVE